MRVRVEQMFEAAAQRGDMQVIILRAGDFYGPGTSTDWFDQAMFREIEKGRVSLMGTPGVGHAWAYLPDLARAFEALAALRQTLGSFERFHFAGHFVTPEEMAAAIAAAAPRQLTDRAFPAGAAAADGAVRSDDARGRQDGLPVEATRCELQRRPARCPAGRGVLQRRSTRRWRRRSAPFFAKLPAR